jgi:hypothetical protein
VQSEAVSFSKLWAVTSILFAVELVALTPGGTRFDPIESGRCGSTTRTRA